MLIPRFTLRWLLGLTTLCPGVSLVLASPVRGETWALGVPAAIGGLLMLTALHVGTFGIAWLWSRVERAVFDPSDPDGVSPFAESPALQSPFAAAVPAAPTEGPPPLTG